MLDALYLSLDFTTWPMNEDRQLPIAYRISPTVQSLYGLPPPPVQRLLRRSRIHFV